MRAPSSALRPVSPGNHDWPAHWKAKHALRTSHPVGQRNWDERAGRFTRMAAELNPERDPLARALAREVRASDTALDVGAGAGRYALPLAGMAKQVTAVEPSAGMRASLEQAIAERGIDNLKVVAGAWQDVEVEPHDVVLCAHVTYFVSDIVPFIEKLDAAARRACFIHVRIDEAAASFHPLWHQLFEGPYPSECGFADLYPLLLGMGIRANVEVAGGRTGPIYSTFEDAFEAARQNLGLAPDDRQHDSTIKAFLEANLTPRGDRLGLPGSNQLATISWSKE